MKKRNGKGNGPVGAVSFIGSGAMGEALAAGVLRAGLVGPEAVWLADADEARLQTVAASLGVAAADNKTAAAAADAVVVAVKPDVVPAVLDDIAPVLRPGSVVISVAAGVQLASLEGRLPRNTAVVRAMPNTPALVGAGATALARGVFADDGHLETARRIFSSVGTVAVVPEPWLDAVTGLSGSGPAFVYMFIEALADGGVHAGLSRDVALQLAAQTVLGAAKMVQETGRHPGLLKDMVTSPGGTTIAGVAALEARAFRGVCMEAVIAAAARARQLGREQEASSR